MKATFPLELVLHRAPLVIIDGLVMDEDLWRFDINEIRCGESDSYWQFAHQEIELDDTGAFYAKTIRGTPVLVQVYNHTPFTPRDLA